MGHHVIIRKLQACNPLRCISWTWPSITWWPSSYGHLWSFLMQSHENTFDVILSWALVIFLDAIPWESPNPQRYRNTSYGLELKAQLTISYHATRSHVVHKLCLSVDQLEFNLSSLSWSTFIFTLWSSGDMNILRLVEENDIPFWIIIIRGRIQHMWPKDQSTIDCIHCKFIHSS